MIFVPWRVSGEVRFEPKPLYLKRVGDVAKSGLDADSGRSETDQLGPKLDFQKSFKNLSGVNDFGVLEVSKV